MYLEFRYNDHGGIGSSLRVWVESLDEEISGMGLYFGRQDNVGHTQVRERWMIRIETGKCCNCDWRAIGLHYKWKLQQPVCSVFDARFL